MRLTFLLALLVIFITGCRDKNIIEEDKFVKIYSDLLLASDSTSADSAKIIVFKKHRIDKISYNKTVEYYNANPEEWEMFFNKVIAHIEQLKKDSSSAL